MMALDRGRLARIDRLLFAEIDESSGSQMVRVPVSDAVWSSWRRYCELLGVSMGEGIGVLVAAELALAVDAEERTVSDLVEEIAHTVEERSKALDERQTQLDAQADALMRRERALGERETTEAMTSRLDSQTFVGMDVGRNEKCPCGSGLKYKRCHANLA